MSNSAILCVDDERVVLDSLKTQLKEEFGETYCYEIAENAEDAFEIIEELFEEQIEVLVIVSDWLMPGMKGDEFLVRVHEKYPNIINVMLTGQADEHTLERAHHDANLHGCLYKPWNGNELIETIKAALAKL
jgi:CheY-like chemotaxis protein